MLTFKQDQVAAIAGELAALVAAGVTSVPLWRGQAGPTDIIIVN